MSNAAPTMKQDEQFTSGSSLQVPQGGGTHRAKGGQHTGVAGMKPLCCFHKRIINVSYVRLCLSVLIAVCGCISCLHPM